LPTNLVPLAGDRNAIHDVIDINYLTRYRGQ
jgi:hypothetical protein